jgi:Fe-S-cluster-containing dehydrogenase component
MPMTRREVIQTGIAVGAGMAVSGAAIASARGKQAHADATGPSTVRNLDTLKNIPARPGEDPLMRMQRDLVKAMAKPMEQRHWVMVIDQRKCVGCHACTVSCIAENHLPPGVVYRPVVIEESGSFPNIKLEFTPRPCMQCDQPPCVPVCPVSATWKRADGIVAVDYDACIGCRYCLTACPYGARTSDFGEDYQAQAALGADGQAVAGARATPNEGKPSQEYGKSWDRKDHASPAGNARKCHFCLHKLENGQLPACTSTCIGRATYFGDTNDPDSLVSELITKHNVQTLLPHKGTKPRVYYIV